jgi:hypothetical protein
MNPRVRLVLLAAVVSLAAAGAAVASGALSTGDVLPAGEPVGVSAPPSAVDQRVVAEGSTPVGGSWWMTTYRSERLLDERGAEMQPAGLPCLSLVLRDPPAGTRLVRRWFCGERGEHGFNAAGLPVTGPGGSEIILFGQVPEGAATVEFTADGGERIRARSHEGPADLHGDLWVIPVPAGRARQSADVAWTSDASGRAEGKLDVSRDLGTRLAP